MSDDQRTTRTEPGEVAEALSVAEGAPATVEAAVADATTTSLACYFINGSNVTWYWGLNNDNSYYKLNGSWGTTPYTKLTKFFTSTNSSDIGNAAQNAKNYYNLGSYSLFAIFAADSSSGYNYPVVANGQELYPDY